MPNATCIRDSLGINRSIGVIDTGFWMRGGYPVSPLSSGTVHGGYEPFDDYAEGVDVIGLNGGYTLIDSTWSWDGAWIARDRDIPANYGTETFDSYIPGQLVDGLSGGSYWSAAWGADAPSMTGESLVDEGGFFLTDEHGNRITI